MGSLALFIEVMQYFFALVGGLCIYFLPSIISIARRHPNGTPIFIVNLFFGWTIAGWLIAMSWAITTLRRY